MQIHNRGVEMIKLINEAKDVVLYKKLLNCFGAFCDKFPATSMERIFDIIVTKGKAVLPTDSRALAILQHIIDSEEDEAVAVQKITNTRFSELPTKLKPVIKNGNKHELAFWCVDRKVFDLTRDLLRLDTNSSGHWSSADGAKAALLDTSE